MRSKRRADAAVDRLQPAGLQDSKLYERILRPAASSKYFDPVTVPTPPRKLNCIFAHPHLSPILRAAGLVASAYTRGLRALQYTINLTLSCRSEIGRQVMDDNACEHDVEARVLERKRFNRGKFENALG